MTLSQSSDGLQNLSQAKTAQVQLILRTASIAIVGVGGLGCPAALSLIRSGVGKLTLIDDDVVEFGNLHRQPLFTEADIGKHKAVAARDALLHDGSLLNNNAQTFQPDIQTMQTRCDLSNVEQVVATHDLILECSDNFQTKFMLAEQSHLQSKHIVHAGSQGWNGWVLAKPSKNSTEAKPSKTTSSQAQNQNACLACVFEEAPLSPNQSCSAMGVVGPAVGFLGALQAVEAINILLQNLMQTRVYNYDGHKPRLHQSFLNRVAHCPICS